MKRLLSLLMAAVCAATLGGCQGASGGDSGKPESPESTGVLEFRLGQGSMSEPGGQVEFPLDGLLAAPEGKENCPVVFLLHGAHGAQDVAGDRYYQGFSYLAQALRQQGYLVMAINTNRAYSLEPFEGNEYQRAYGIFQGYYDLLARANQGEKVFDVDLTGRINLSQLNFIGHSRGGDDSLYIAKQLQESGSQQVQSVLLVASPLMVTPEESYTDVPTGIILSQYDGDVTGLETATLFNRAWFLDDLRTTPVTMAFLYGANHNQYNSAIPQADSLAPPQGVTYLNGQTQRDFLASYAAAFLNTFNRGDGDVKTLGSDAPKTLGFDFMPSVILPGGQRLLPGGASTKGDAGVELVNFSQIPGQNTLAPFNHPGPLEQDLPLYKMAWAGGQQKVSLAPTATNWAEYGTLTLLLASDPTRSNQEEGSALALSVTLTDAKGGAATVELNAGESAPLRYLPTQVVNLFEGMEGVEPYLMAEHHTPLGTQLIGLQEFAGVDLSCVEQITIQSQSPKASWVFGGIQIN